MFKWTFLERENIVESRTGPHPIYSTESASAVCEGSGELGQAGVKSLQFINYHLSN